MPSSRFYNPLRLWRGSAPSTARTGDVWIGDDRRQWLAVSDADESRVETALNTQGISRIPLNSWGPIPGYSGGLATAATVSGTATLIPWVIGRQMTPSAFAVDVSTAAIGATTRLGTFASNPDTGVPTTLLYDSGTVSAATSGTKTFGGSLSTVYLPGLYWVALISQSATPTYRSHPFVSSGFVYGAAAAAPATATALYNCYQISGLGAGFSSNPTVTAANLTSIPNIQFKISA